MTLKLIIDSGHGGTVTDEMTPRERRSRLGTTAGGVTEKEITLGVALDLDTALADLGWDVEVHLTRESDTALTQGDRGKLSRALDADFVLSLHVDARFVPVYDCHGFKIGYRPDPAGTGLVCYHYPYSRAGIRVARAITERAPAQLKSRHPIWPTARSPDWRKNAHAIVCAHRAPVCLVEMFFATNPRDVAAFDGPDMRAGVVAALCAGVRSLIP